MSGLITASFRTQALAMPDRATAFLATNPVPQDIANQVAKGAAMLEYSRRLDATREELIAITKPIAKSVLILKAGLGAAMPAKPPSERGQGRGGKESSAPDTLDFNNHTIAAYRKIAANIDQLNEFCDTIDDVPTQGGFLKYVQDPHVANNSGENEWYTPPEYIEAARAAMGGIDLDPATSQKAQETVKAEKFFTADDDGLSKPWKGKVWLNPPYAKDLIGKFCDKLAEGIDGGKVTAAILLVNNATDTVWFHRVASKASAVCFIKGRIAFHDCNGEPKNKPLQGQMAMYFGRHPADFTTQFSRLGECFYGSRMAGGLTALRAVIQSLELHEAATVRDWILERLH